jgi:sulfite reductase (NADPH) hemoprotein beta-component
LEVAKSGLANFRFSGNQNVILSDIHVNSKRIVEDILGQFGVIESNESSSAIRKNSMACVALNTCPLALAEGQRYLPHLISKIEPLLKKYFLDKEEIIIRMTGCPNGCARPYVAEIGLVGTAYGHYNLHFGGDRVGQRLNKIYKENLDEDSILFELNNWLRRYSSERKAGETFGDFALREIKLN